MVLRLMLINSVFWKPQFQGGVLKIGGDVRENSGPAEHVETLGICHKYFCFISDMAKEYRDRRFSELVK